MRRERWGDMCHFLYLLIVDYMLFDFFLLLCGCHEVPLETMNFCTFMFKIIGPGSFPLA